MVLEQVTNSIRPHFEEFLAHPNVFDYYGMERGGHFAVLRWLLDSGPKPYCLSMAAHTNRPGCGWSIGNGWHTSVRKPIAGALTYGPDVSLDDAPSRLSTRRVIVCVRDIRNLLASRRRWNTERRRLFRVNLPAVATWSQYAHQALGDTDYFDGCCVPVMFDLWATSKDYRNKVIASLNSTFDWDLASAEDAVARVSPAAGGSSFDGMDYDAQAWRMNVTERWHTSADDTHIQELLTPEVLDLNRRLLDGLR